MLADLIWPVLVALGAEQVRIVPGITAFTPLEFISYPYSHSLAMLALWGVLYASAFARARVSFAIVFVLVVSHWFLDVATHMPDMPLYPGSSTYGLGLWNSVAGTRAVELTLFAAGVWLYLRATASHDRIGRWATWGLIAFLLVGFLADAPPPPSVTALWMMALVLSAIIIALAWWADRHRMVHGR